MGKGITGWGDQDRLAIIQKWKDGIARKEQVGVSNDADQARLSSVSEALKASLEAEYKRLALSNLARVREIPLDSSYAEDDQMNAVLSDYDNWVSKHGIEFIAVGDKSRAALSYQGSLKCAACHLQQFENWKTTVHAHAMETLRGAERAARSNPECLSCHVTGFLLPGGPFRESDIGPYEGVQCESCHVPVESHPGEGKFRKVTSTTCIGCHTEARDPRFDYESYLEYGTCQKGHVEGKNRVNRK
jgi:predicted CXXCH cytochrome family protein